MFVDTKERPQGEQVDAIAPSKLKLSAAIRIGAKIRPQCVGWAFRDGKSCAWGAAWEGSGHPYQELGNYADIMLDTPGWRTANEVLRAKLGWGIAELNDNGATREQIAGHLESQGL